MGKRQKPKFYAVARGRKVGIFNTWAECEAQVKGVGGARHKSFLDRKDAEEYLEAQHRDYKDPKQHSIRCTEYNPTREEILAEYAGEGLILSGYLNDKKGSTSEVAKDDGVERGDDNGETSKPTKKRKNTREEAKSESEGFISFDSSEGGLEDISDSRRYFDVSQESYSSPRYQRELQLDAMETNAISKASSSAAADSIKRIAQKPRRIVVYTDGAASGNGKEGSKAGYGVYWPEAEDPMSDLHNLNESERVPGEVQTNNRAELLAIIRAVQLCPDPGAQLIIYTDSMYCINAINKWQANWRKNNWLNSKKEVVMNKDLIRLLERELKGRHLRPTLVYVKGHSPDISNGKADKLAVEGAQKPDIPRNQWRDLEPSDSEDEGARKAIAAWEKMGFTRKEAERKAGIKSL